MSNYREIGKGSMRVFPALDSKRGNKRKGCGNASLTIMGSGSFGNYG
jgi:hypothetical protein